MASKLMALGIICFSRMRLRRARHLVACKVFSELEAGHFARMLAAQTVQLAPLFSLAGAFLCLHFQPYRFSVARACALWYENYRFSADHRDDQHAKTGVEQALQLGLGIGALGRDIESLHLWGCGGFACLGPRKPAIDLVNSAVDDDEFQTLSPQTDDLLANHPMMLRRQCSALKALVPKIGAMHIGQRWHTHGPP